MQSQDVLLGLIKAHPGVSGYQLRRTIQRTTSFFFSISLSSIYPLLHTLAEAGLVTYEVEELVGKPDRKVYSITDSGRERLEEALREPPADTYSFVAFQDTLLRLGSMTDLGDEAIRTYLEQSLDIYRAHRRRVVDGVADASEDVTVSGPMRDRRLAMWAQMNKYLQDDLDLKIRWLEELMEGLDSDLDT